MFIYEHLIIFTNLFGAFGRLKLDLVKIIFHFLEDCLIEKFIQKDLKEDQKFYILHRLEKWIAIFSDHIYSWIFNYIYKPVWGIWELHIRPGKDNAPLSGGLFNREVYLEGLLKKIRSFTSSIGWKNHMQYSVIIRVANVVAIQSNLLTQWVNSMSIFFWYKLLPTTSGPQNFPKIRVLKVIYFSLPIHLTQE